MASKKAKPKRNQGMSAAHEAAKLREAKAYVEDVVDELNAREHDGRVLVRRYWQTLNALFKAHQSSSEAVSAIISKEREVARRQRTNRRYYFIDLVTPPHIDHLIQDSPGHSKKNKRIAVDELRRARSLRIRDGRGYPVGMYQIVNYNILLADQARSPLSKHAVVIGHVRAHNPEAALERFFADNKAHPSHGRILAVAGIKLPMGYRLRVEGDPQRRHSSLRASKLKARPRRVGRHAR